MVTPIFKVQTVNPSVIAASPNKITWAVQDSTGASVDISSGYGATLQGRPSLNANLLSTAQDIGSLGTFDYSVLGQLSWSLDDAGANSYLNDVPSLGMAYSLFLTNDSGVTKSLVAQGQIGLVVPQGY